jgi:damage-control phosphatase, subfamily I
MRTSMDCMPCLVRHALDAARHASNDSELHERVVRELLHAAGEMDLSHPPVKMGQFIQRLVCRLTGKEDPYEKAKSRFNAFAMRLYPLLKGRIESAANPMDAAVRVAIAGNFIDFSVGNHVDEASTREVIDRALVDRLEGDLTAFAAAVEAVRHVLYLADNAGEIVFDRLLIEQLGPEKVTLVVRGGPAINDATWTDAQEAGLTELVEVIDNGSDVPGTILAECSEAFRRRFDQADLVLAKGQGNFETLHDVDNDTFFLLKAKCVVVARHLGCERNTSVVWRSAYRSR